MSSESRSLRNASRCVPKTIHKLNSNLFPSIFSSCEVFAASLFFMSQNFLRPLAPFVVFEALLAIDLRFLGTQNSNRLAAPRTWPLGGGLQVDGKTLASFSFLNIVSIHKLTLSCLEKFISLKGCSFGILWADFNFSNPKRSCPYVIYQQNVSKRMTLRMTEDSANEVLGSDMGTWPNPESGNHANKK